MISGAELTRKAFDWGVDAMVVDLDYSLGWFIAGLYRANQQANYLHFKGGTCLRKCYFGDYRFSEDLDFTATIRVDPDLLGRWIEAAATWSADNDGPNFEAAPSRVETIQDEYGGETYQARLYFRGPLRWGGSPRAIRLDVTRNEVLVSPPESRALLHPYSDADLLATSVIPCYSPAEIMTEKLRAIGGQRRFAISRDLYDIHQLSRSGLSGSEVAPILAGKFAAREVDPIGLSVHRLTERQDDFREDWERQLSYLMQDEKGLDFETAWATVMCTVRQVEDYRRQGRP